MSTSPTAPDEVTSVCVTITFPANPEMPEAIHDRPVAIVGGVYAGDAEEGMEVPQPLRELGTALFDMSRPDARSWRSSRRSTRCSPATPFSAYWKSQYLDELSDEAIDVIAAKAQDRPAPLTLVNTFHMGGAIDARRPGGRPRSPSARRRSWSRSTACGRTRRATRTASPGSRSAWEDMKKFGTGGVYLNFTGLATTRS